MNKIIGLLLIVVFVSGCATFTTEDDSSSTFKYSGRQGISIDFVDGKPPEEFWRGEEVDVALNVKNRGKYELNSGEFVAKYKGTAAADLNGGEDGFTNIDVIRKIDEFGESNEVIVDLAPLIYDKEMFTLNYETLIKVGYCYPYQTLVESDDFYVGDSAEYVEKGKVVSGDNSASPVHVKNLKESVSKDKIKFSFVVEKVGRGDVVESCEEDGKEMVKVTVINPSDASCQTFGGSSSGEVELMSGRSYVYCEIPKLSEEEYQSQFSAVLDFFYKDSISKTVIIKNDNI